MNRGPGEHRRRGTGKQTACAQSPTFNQCPSRSGHHGGHPTSLNDNTAGSSSDEDSSSDEEGEEQDDDEYDGYEAYEESLPPEGTGSIGYIGSNDGSMYTYPGPSGPVYTPAGTIYTPDVSTAGWDNGARGYFQHAPSTRIPRQDFAGPRMSFNAGSSTRYQHPSTMQASDRTPPSYAYASPSARPGGPPPGRGGHPSHLNFLPHAVQANNPSLVDYTPPANPTTANTRPQKPPGKDRKGNRPPRKPKVFYPADLFGEKRPSGVMEAYEVAKMAGPTKKEKKAMGRKKLRAMTWPCPLCSGTFQGERHVRSHLRSRAHIRSTVVLDRETFGIWIAGWKKSGGGRRRRKGKKKKKGKKGKGTEGNESNKGKKAPPVVPKVVPMVVPTVVPPVVPAVPKPVMKVVEMQKPSESTVDSVIESVGVLGLKEESDVDTEDWASIGLTSILN